MDDIDEVDKYGIAATRSDGTGFTTADDFDAEQLPALVPRSRMYGGFASDAVEEPSDAPGHTRTPQRKQTPKLMSRQEIVDHKEEETGGDISPPDDDSSDRRPKGRPLPRLIGISAPPHSSSARGSSISDKERSPVQPPHPLLTSSVHLPPQTRPPPQPQPQQVAVTAQDAMDQFDRSWDFLMGYIQSTHAGGKGADIVAYLSIFRDSTRITHTRVEGTNEWEKAMQYILSVMDVTEKTVKHARPSKEKIEDEMHTLVPSIVPSANSPRPSLPSARGNRQSHKREKVSKEASSLTTPAPVTRTKTPPPSCSKIASTSIPRGRRVHDDVKAKSMHETINPSKPIGKSDYNTDDEPAAAVNTSSWHGFLFGK